MADNSFGKTVRQSVNLDVMFAPKITVTRPRTAQAIGYNIEMICEVEAHPAPATNWYRNDKEILSENSYSVSNMGNKGGITTSILHIYGVESYHYGDYYCNATNEIGTTRAKLNLYGKIY